MVTNDFKKTIKNVVTQLLGVLNARNKDVIARRFGLKTGEKQTLESIGKVYGITRERVRQIEEASIKLIREHLEKGFSAKVQPFVTLASGIIDQANGIITEEDLFEKFSGSSKNSSANSSLAFFLMLDSQIKRYVEDDDFNTFWSINSAKQEEFINTVNTFIKSLERKNDPVDEAGIPEFCSTSGLFFKEPLNLALASILAISKNIDCNVFGQIGLTTWSQIKPRGVRDKSFLVLKRASQPKHFREITRLINVSNFSKNKANVQTVHNELIKDSRFVLVGRGMYGLSEWGYEPGTIKELIVKLLKKSGSMSRDKIVAHVMSVRLVKANTVVLGLQDRKLFQHDDSGHIALKKV